MNVIAPERDLPASHLEWLKLLYCQEFAFGVKAVERAGGQTGGASSAPQAGPADDAGGNGVQFHQAADGVVLAPE